MRNLLVTGGAGFIGANFVNFWLKHHPGDRVVVLDVVTYAGNPSSLEQARARSEFTFVRGDIRSVGLAERLLREHEVTTVVHLAAESHVDRSIEGPDLFIDTNVLGTHALLKAARKVWLEEGVGGAGARFHHVSTDEVYGSLGPAEPAFTETTPYAPNSPYAASKAGADHLVRAYHHTYGLPVTTSNCSNNYGPYQFPEKLIPLMLVNALDGRPLPIYGDGLNVRDWLYVEDHCRAIERVLLDGRLGETYNMGGKNEWTNIAIVQLLCRLIDEAFAREPALGLRFPRAPAAAGTESARLITFVKDRAGHDRRYAVDSGKIERDLNFNPRESFETGLRKTITWYLQNEDWWRAVMNGSYRDWIRQHYSQPAQ
ncbi:MAG TPA: dTDP-glucose 4,6-dehydratase [Gemmatimonadales bacterium]